MPPDLGLPLPQREVPAGGRRRPDPLGSDAGLDGARTMRRGLWVAAIVIVAYVGLSSLLHYVVVPEPGPDLSDLPRAGTTIVNERISSRFVFRQTTIETDGRLFEWDNFVEPGGGPIDLPHLHPHMREVFHVVGGEIRFVIEGEERIVGAGSEIAAEPGSVHTFQNVSDQPAYMISRFEAAGDEPWAELARKGLLPDMGFVQAARAGGLGRIGPIQGLVGLSIHKQSYPDPRFHCASSRFLLPLTTNGPRVAAGYAYLRDVPPNKPPQRLRRIEAFRTW
jgi:mannose-6-phosphate isomerase-like protein (cupin superfamily)